MPLILPISTKKSDSTYHQNAVLLVVDFPVDFNDPCERINRQDTLWVFIHTFSFQPELHYIATVQFNLEFGQINVVRMACFTTSWHLVYDTW